MMIVMAMILGTVMAVFLIWKVLNLEGKQYTGEFDKKRQFLSRQQMLFLTALQESLHSSSLVFSKVPVGEILLPRPIQNSLSQGDLTPFLQFTADFIICNKTDGEILAVIDLATDISEQTAADQDQNKTLSEAFTSAQVPYSRVGVQAYYSPEDMQELLDHLFKNAPVAQEQCEENVTLEAAAENE